MEHKKIRIGAVTIGQSPRTDVAPEFESALGMDAELIQAGALDGLSLEEVRKLAPNPGDYILVTRMRDGTEVKIAEHHILDRMKAAIRQFENDGLDLIVLFCTGQFPEIDSRSLILKPDVLMVQTVPGILKKGRLGAVVPSPDQIPAMTKKWEQTGLEVVTAAASPYSGKEEDFRAAGRSLAEQKADLIVLDCIGYNSAMKKIIKEESGKPVILPRTLLGRIAGEIAGG
ncbi:AroM family protein [Breznakiella homolactica]|uniref:AroM family protein n=1 Tax=Breznakiella homolactica TaxID=2798577 RepID=A0A7T7XM69_9SPIR|nr:AroM family protein [Breznakiella homolactica]QQO08905.1 AroM family protein [Breznakiella homolactica]